jgi:adenylate kinase family enzyme
MDIQKLKSEAGAPHKRYVVVGTSGSGKTTLSGELARELGYPHIELDDIQWMPEWQMRPTADFCAEVEVSIAGDRWVVDGNYSKARDIVWPRADAVIWLDRPFHVVLRRVFWRSLVRAVTRRVLWDGCRESLRRTFFSRESIILWSVQTWKKNRIKYERLSRLPEYRHLDFFRVTSADVSEVRVQRGDSSRRKAVSIPT